MDETTRAIVDLDLNSADVDDLECLTRSLRHLAHDCLEGDPNQACELIRAAHVLDVVRVGIAVAKAHPARVRLTGDGAVAKPTKTKAPGLPKVKHVYGPAGLCILDHGGSGVCGKLRERRPREGSVASVPVADDRTLAIPGTEGGAA